MRRLLSMIMLALAAGTLGPAVVAVAAIHRPTGPAPQGFGVRLVDVPGSAANNPRALRYIIDYLPTGAVIHRRILIINQEAHTAHFTVYADAARISNGSFTGDSGATQSELTGWISAQYQTLTLRPLASAMDMITIKVPPGATRGEHYGVIWVQQAAHARASSGLGVNEVTRVGIRIYLAVGQGGAPPTSFAITSVTGHRSARGWPSMAAHVDNTGGRAVDLSGTARLSGGPGDTSRRSLHGTAGHHPRARPVGKRDIRSAQEPAQRSLAGQGNSGERAYHGHGHGHCRVLCGRSVPGGPVHSELAWHNPRRPRRRPRRRPDPGALRSRAPPRASLTPPVRASLNHWRAVGRAFHQRPPDVGAILSACLPGHRSVLFLD